MQVKDIIRKVRQIEIRAKRRTDAMLMGQYHSAFKGQGMTFAEVRPYQFGDDIRHIDWNKTARFREPFVKVMEEERELTVMLMVDISASMDYGTHHQLKREYVAEICATLGFSAVGNNDKVGLILFADKVYKVVPPAKGRKHVLALISNILDAEYRPAATDLNAALNYLMKAFRKRAAVFVFSDFNDDFDIRNMRVAAARHQLLGIGVYDEKDQTIPDVGYALLTDVETGQQFWANTSGARWRYRYAEESRQRLRNVREAFEKSSSSFIQLEAPEDYTRPLYNYFQTK